MNDEKFILDSLNTLICKANKYGYFTYLNSYWTRCLGWELSVLYDVSFFDFVHPADLNATRAIFSKIINEKETVSGFRNRYRKKNGEYVWLEWFSRVSSSVEVFASAVPISERVQLEEGDKKQQMLLSQVESLVSIGYWSLEVESSALFWSNGIYHIHGVDKSSFEPTLESAIHSYHPDDIPTIQKLVAQALKENQGWEVQLRIVRPSGEIRHVQSKGQVETDEQGNTRSIFGIFQDITETKNLIDRLANQTSELETSNLRLKESIKAGNVGTWDWDVVNNALLWDTQMYHIYGLPGSNQAGTVNLWENALLDDDRAKATKALNDALDGSKDYNIEFRIMRPDGRIRHIHGNATVLRDENGSAIRMLGTNLDITERYESAREIHRLKKRNQALLDHSPACHKIIDLNFNLQYMNVNGFKMFSLPINDSWYGKRYPFEFFPDSSKTQMEEKLTSVILSKEKESFESYAHDSKGCGIWLNHTIIPVFKDNEKELDYLTVVSTDITSKKEIEKQLIQREKMDAIGQLAGGVAHDFNNHLSSIIGFTELLELNLEDSALKSFTKKILSAAENSSNLTNKLLAFSRQNNVTLEAVDVHEQINEILSIVSHTIDKSTGIVCNLTAANHCIMGDKSLLQNALMNLLINARDALHEGGQIVIETSNTLTDMHKVGSLKISISDNGVGIEESSLSKIFEPFFTTKEVGKGTGLGLSTTYAAISQLKGKIDVDSQIGRGSTFEITFPIVKVSSSAPVNQNPLFSRSVSNSETILVVDDDDLIRDMLRRALDKMGYKYLFAENGRIAIDLFKKMQQDISLVVLDMNMPVMGGMRTLQLLLQMNPNVKVLISSGFNSKYSESELKSKGAYAFLRKPYRLNEFERIISDSLIMK